MSKRTLKSSNSQRVALSKIQASATSDATGGPAAVQRAIEALHARHSEQIDAMGQQIEGLTDFLDSMDRQTTGLRMGIGRGPARSRELEAVEQFARTGKFEASMSTDSNPDGGFLVPEEAEQSVASVMRDESPLRRVARIVTTGQAAWKKTIWLGGAGADWAGEHQARPQTDTSSLAEITIPANEIYANPALTNLIIEDARIDVAAELLGEVAKAFADKESVAFVSGDGNKRPRGFLTYPTALTKDASRAFGTIQYLKTGDASGFLAPTDSVSPVDILIDMVHSLKTGHRKNAVWLMNSGTAAVARKFKDSDGKYVWEQSAKAGTPSMLLGYPVELDENMPDVAAGEFPIALADWQAAYVIVDRIGISTIRDPYTNKPYVMFYTRKRVGGGLFDSNAIKLLKVAS